MQFLQDLEQYKQSTQYRDIVPKKNINLRAIQTTTKRHLREAIYQKMLQNPTMPAIIETKGIIPECQTVSFMKKVLAFKLFSFLHFPNPTKPTDLHQITDQIIRTRLAF